MNAGRKVREELRAEIHICYFDKNGTADIFRGIMVSLYVKEKENGHVQAYAPTGAMVLK